MTWFVKVGKSWRDTNDLPLSDLLEVEKISGQPWALFNPLLNGLAAKAAFAAFLVADGQADEAAQAQVGAMASGDFRERWRFRDDDNLPGDWEDGLPVVDPKASGAASTD